MWRLIKHAFLVRVRSPLLGDLPVNAVGVACFGILGIVNPGFWFLGAGLEAAFLLSLASNRRFQKLVRAKELAARSEDGGDEVRARLGRLDDRRRKRYADLERKCSRVAQLYRERNVEDFLVEGNLSALDKLRTIFVELLSVQQDIDTADQDQIEEHVRSRIAALEIELAAQRLKPTVRQSKSATLSILKRRLESLENREQTLEEIDSDLLRVEAQVDLAVEHALMEGRPQVISTRIELASHLLDGSPFSVPDIGENLAAPDPTASGDAPPQAPQRARERGET
jgi:hypothetical protein